MTLTPVGSAADDAGPVARTSLGRGLPKHLVGQPDDTADVLLDAIRAALVPGDPVARLLAGWTAPPVRAVVTYPAGSSPTAGSRSGSSPSGCRAGRTDV